jgi:phage transcriptional regulator, rinA family
MAIIFIIGDNMTDDKIREIEEILFTYKDYCIINKDNKYADMIADVESALFVIRKNKRFDFIDLRYFKNMTYEEIAEELDVDIRTVFRIRKRLLSKLKLHFKIRRLL